MAGLLNQNPHASYMPYSEAIALHCSSSVLTRPQSPEPQLVFDHSDSQQLDQHTSPTSIAPAPCHHPVTASDINNTVASMAILDNPLLQGSQSASQGGSPNVSNMASGFQDSATQEPPAYSKQVSVSDENIPHLVKRLKEAARDDCANTGVSRSGQEVASGCETQCYTPQHEGQSLARQSSNETRSDSSVSQQLLAPQPAHCRCQVHQTPSPTANIPISFQHNSLSTPLGPVTTSLPAVPQMSTGNNPNTVVLTNCHVTINHLAIAGPSTIARQLPLQSSNASTAVVDPNTCQGGLMTRTGSVLIASHTPSRAPSLNQACHEKSSTPPPPPPPLRLPVSTEDEELCTHHPTPNTFKKALYTLMSINHFSHEVVVFPPQGLPQFVGMQLDTGSDYNIIPMSLVKQFGLDNSIEERLAPEGISLSGDKIVTLGSIELTWAISRHSKQRHTGFLVVPEENLAVTELFLGAPSISTYNLLRLRFFGSRKHLPKQSREDESRNSAAQAEYERKRQENERLKAESMRKKREAEPARHSGRRV